MPPRWYSPLRYQVATDRSNEYKNETKIGANPLSARMAIATFPEVTLLITHYNRSRSLERLLTALRNLGFSFGAIVVSDDGSRPEHVDRLQQLRQQFNLHVVASERNRGLGHNFNQGQDAVTTEYTLYIQEDFVPNPEFVPAFAAALKILKDNPNMDIARFYAYFRYPFLTPLEHGFAEMQFSQWSPGYRKFYMYSDHPHLRRSNFLEKFGRYREGVKGDVTEYQMMISFLHKKGKGIFFERYQDLLIQQNSADEPSTMKRNFWRETNNYIVAMVRHFYRHIKINWDYLRGK